jgi:Tol biopolymer transport system component
MGEVYRASDPRLGRLVAIKVISSGREANPDRLRRFMNEARAAGALNHPNVLSVFDTGHDLDAPYVVFELLEGETLRQRLRRGVLPPRMAVEQAAQICQGLAAAHDKGIVHRDLKPDNLFLTRDGRVKILDFGLAKLTQVEEADADSVGSTTRTATTPGMLLGTVAYMSPEQARGAPADSRSDIFALGATLYEMLRGRPAFERATPAETLSAILTQDPDAIDSSPEHPMPATLGPIVRRCLEKDPAQRFQSARDLGFALSVLSGSAPGGAVGTPAARRSRKHWLPPLAIGALAVGALAYSVAQRSVATPTAPLTVVPFTTFRGQEISPSFSPDGSHIAFAWTGEDESREDKFDLYVQVMGGEKPLRLTHRPGRWMTPAWSPDGRRIAFSRAGKDGRGIYVVPALGGPERRLLDVANDNFDYEENTLLSWSPDGKHLVLANLDALGHGTGVTTSLLNVETLEKRSLPSPSEKCQWTWMPAFSPDGKSVAVVCVQVWSVNELFTIPVAGGSARSVAVVPGYLSGLTWTADGRDLIFASSGSLWRVSAGGGEPEKLLAGRDAEWPALSRAGDRLAFTQRVVNTNIWRLALADPIHPAGPPERLVSSSRMQRHPAFSPDGRRLVFESNRSGSGEVWVSDADGSDAVRMTAFGGGSPAWSPDGRHIAFDSRVSGDGALYVIGIEGGPPRRVETGLAESSQPAWSPDGKWLYFWATIEKVGQVFKVRTEGGTPVQITKKGGYRPRVSLDGRRVYHMAWSGEIWSASVDGGDERPVAGMPARSGKWYADWAPTDSGIYFIDGDPPRPGIHFLDFATAKVRRLADIPGRPEIGGGGLALSPDGRSLLFSQVDEIASDIMLIEGFR